MMKFSLFIVILCLGFVGSCIAAGPGGASIHQDKTWCVVKVGATQSQLQQYLDTECNQVDCSPVQPGGSCYDPNTLENHASYVLNLEFRKTGTCNPKLGLPSITDPSFGPCRYT